MADRYKYLISLKEGQTETLKDVFANARVSDQDIIDENHGTVTALLTQEQQMALEGLNVANVTKFDAQLV